MKTIRVLLVDDEEDLVVTLAERLGMRGVETEWATTAEQAIERVKRQPFDVAVLDIKLPRISGFEIKRKMLSIAPTLRFIFMTGHGSENDFEEGMTESGAAYCLFKPIDIETLLTKIQAIAS